MKNYALDFSIFKIRFGGMLRDTTSNYVGVIKKLVSMIFIIFWAYIWTLLLIFFFETAKYY
jgi:hypothetical protein